MFFGSPSKGPRRPVVRYALGWLATGAVVAALLVGALRGCRDDELPPVERADLEEAVQDAGCELVNTSRARPGNPPGEGPAISEPARPAVYERPPNLSQLIAAVRRGIVVIHYREPIERQRLDELRVMFELVPEGTVVTPNATSMPYVVAAVSWRRVLGCPRFTDATLDALRLFRARNLGRGPDGRP